MTGRRVAVVGAGVVSSCGIGRDAFWDGLHESASGTERPVEGFDPLPLFDNPKEARRVDRFTQFALAAAAEAWEQAGAPSQLVGPRAGSWVGSGIGGLDTLGAQSLVMAEKGPRRVSPFTVPMMMANACGAAISMRYGLQGPCENTVTACAAGTHSIGNGARLIKDGRCDLVFTGGSEAAITPLAVAAFGNMTALTSSGISRPFDVDRDGFVIAEGAAVLVLEEWESARARGVEILAEVLGSASTADAHHITAPSPGGEGAIRCMRLALQDAGLGPASITQINAHGTSTPLNDRAEAEAVAEVFGSPGPPMTSIKGVTGHSLGAAGAIEAVSVVLSMQYREIPPTMGLSTYDPDLPKLDIVTGTGRDWEPGPTLSNSFGFGGHNGSLVIAPPS
ncbi:MAG TPA: beta-ketoacyl-[acyl-carrier-protein] synthase family protein [Microthrixaceae bacterium]|nr:beta-ketoacyl-[acyl-carrier-protein] synthase family protein [Microthrixaceae bacterium]